MTDAVILDITRLLGRTLACMAPTGVDRVTRAYIRHFGPRARALVRFGGRWIVPCQTESQKLFDGLLTPDNIFRIKARFSVVRHYLFGAPDIDGHVLFNMDHNGLADPSYAAEIQRRNLKPYYFLHDLIPIHYPEYGRPEARARHVKCIDTMQATGRGVIVNSDATRAEFQSYAQKRGWAPRPLLVARLAPPDLLKPSDERPLPCPYFVMLGTIEPRKNHLLLLHIWRALIQAKGEAAPKLVLIGRRGWECEQILDLLDRCVPLRGFVIEQPHCTDTDLARFLFHAQALLLPSFAEGFGLPLIEALSLGTSVIASDLPVFKEIAGTIPEFLDPLDGLGWRQKIEDYANPDSPNRAAQKERLRNFHPPSWADHFAFVESFLERGVLR